MTFPFVALLRRLALILCAAALAAAAWPVWLQWQGNFHEVAPGALYRSAQPDAAALRAAQARYGIRSVLNLRGHQPDSAWYRAEIAASAQLGLVHADLGLAAEQAPDAATLARLVALMRSLPQPVLIHCRSGADRTGLAAALYMAAVLNRAPEEAAAQLSFAYGHVSLSWLSRAAAMDRAWARWAGGHPAAPALRLARAAPD